MQSRVDKPLFSFKKLFFFFGRSPFALFPVGLKPKLGRAFAASPRPFPPSRLEGRNSGLYATIPNAGFNVPMLHTVLKLDLALGIAMESFFEYQKTWNE